MIVFTKHAKDKFGILKRHKFSVSEEQVLATVVMPDLIDYSRIPLLIAQRKIDKNLVLRVVYMDYHISSALGPCGRAYSSTISSFDDIKKKEEL